MIAREMEEQVEGQGMQGGQPICQGSCNVQVRNHVEIMEALDLIDFDAASDVSGSKFYYLRNAAALLEMALVNFAVQVLLPACPPFL